MKTALVETDEFIMLNWKTDPELVDVIVALSPLDRRYVISDFDKKGILYGIIRGWTEPKSKTDKGYIYGDILNAEKLPLVSTKHIFSDCKIYSKLHSEIFIEHNPALFI